MRFSEAFPSNYLKVADLQGRTIELTISNVGMEDVGDDHKPVMYFEGKQKGLVLNKTNGGMIADSYGDEMATWTGRKVLLYPDKTQFQGKIVDCIRVRVPQPEPASNGEEGEIPF